MKHLLLILAIACCGSMSFAQDILLDYDTTLTPDQHGFEIYSTCEEPPWGSNNGILEFYGCPGTYEHSYVSDDDLIGDVSSAQLDITMRILDSDPAGYALELYLWRDSSGYVTKIDTADFGDMEWHDVTIFIDFDEYTYSSFLDGESFDIYHTPYQYGGGSAGFFMGDYVHSHNGWGRVDISSLIITGNLAEPVSNQDSSWGLVKALYR